MNLSVSIVATIFILLVVFPAAAAKKTEDEKCRGEIALNSLKLSVDESNVLISLCDQIGKNLKDLVLSSKYGVAQHPAHYSAVYFGDREATPTTKGLIAGVVSLDLQKYCRDLAHSISEGFFETMEAILQAQDSKPKITLEGFKFNSSVSEISLEYVSDLHINQSIFCTSVVIKNTRHTPSLNFSNTVFLETFGESHLGGLNVREGRLRGLSIRDSILAYVDGDRSIIIGDLSVVGSTSSYFGFRQAGISGSVRLISFTALSNKALDKYFEIKNTGRTNIYGDYLNFNNAEIGGSFKILFSRIAGELAMVEAEAKEVSIRYSRLSSLDLRQITVERDMEFSAVKIGTVENTGPMGCSVTTKPTGDRLKRGLLLTAMDIGGSMTFRRLSVASETAYASRLSKLQLNPYVVVYEDLCLNDNGVEKSVDLSGIFGTRIVASDTRIGRQLILAKGPNGLSWLDSVSPLPIHIARLDLRLLSASSVKTNLAEDWPVGTFVRGANIDFLFLENGAESEIVSDGGVSKAILTALTKQRFLEEGKAPYKFFEKILSDIGAERDAAHVALLAEERETAATEALLPWAFRQLKKYFGGYGIEPTYPMMTSVLFLVVGIVFRIVYVFRYGDCLARTGAPWNGWRVTRETIDAFFFSLDRLVPIFTISKDHGDEIFEHDNATRWYFAVHALTGWVLAAMLPMFLARLLG